MLDEKEWAWLREKTTGDFDHLLFGTSWPFLLSPGFHHLEAASEAICDGALGRRAARLGEFLPQLLDLEHWPALHPPSPHLPAPRRPAGDAICDGALGRRAARFGEFLRQLLDLEHWPAFHASFTDLASLLRSVAPGERSDGQGPAAARVCPGAAPPWPTPPPPPPRGARTPGRRGPGLRGRPLRRRPPRLPRQGDLRRRQAQPHLPGRRLPLAPPPRRPRTA